MKCDRGYIQVGAFNRANKCEVIILWHGKMFIWIQSKAGYSQMHRTVQVLHGINRSSLFFVRSAMLEKASVIAFVLTPQEKWSC